MDSSYQFWPTGTLTPPGRGVSPATLPQDSSLLSCQSPSFHRWVLNEACWESGSETVVWSSSLPLTEASFPFSCHLSPTSPIEHSLAHFWEVQATLLNFSPFPRVSSSWIPIEHFLPCPASSYNPLDSPLLPSCPWHHSFRWCQRPLRGSSFFSASSPHPRPRVTTPQ